jgi:RNA polymerase sigma factor, sigma-70 family
MNGDSTAFRAVMEEYQSYAFAVAFRFLSDEEDAKDVVQDSFISVWKNFPRYNTAIKFTTWLYSIVTNRCYDKLRSRRTRNTTADPSLLASLVSDQNPEREYTNAELSRLIETLTEKLPSKQKMIFVLRDLQGLSIAEVCGVLQISEASVKTNLVYARRHLREILKPYLSE